MPSDLLTYVLDAAHGGDRVAGKSTPLGHRMPNGRWEKDVNLRHALGLSRHLDANAKLTRRSDVNLSLAQRAAMARNGGADAFLSIHAIDRALEPGGHRIWVHSSAGPASRRLARTLAGAVARFGGAPGTVNVADLAVLEPRHLGARTAGCLLELDARDTYGGRDDSPHVERVTTALAEGLWGFRGEALAATTWGLDTDTILTPYIAGVVATPLPSRVAPGGATVDFVCRYLRALSATEVAALHRAGLHIVSICETQPRQPPRHQDEGDAAYNARVIAATRAHYTNAQGRTDATTAIGQASALHQPSDAPIYFAVDYDDTNFYSGNFTNIDDYFRGVNAVMSTSASRYPVGVYGSGCVLTRCRTAGHASFFWQANAAGWCGNRGAWAGANIRQFSQQAWTGVTDGAGHTLNVDFDVSDGGNPGSW